MFVNMSVNLSRQGFGICGSRGTGQSTGDRMRLVGTSHHAAQRCYGLYF